MMREVFVPSMCWFLGAFDTLPTPWHIRPSSLAWYVFRLCANFGFWRSWWYFNDFPKFFSSTGIARLWIKLAWYCRLDSWSGVITFSVSVVCNRVRREIGPRSVALSTLGGGGSKVSGNLDLVCHATGS